MEEKQPEIKDQFAIFIKEKRAALGLSYRDFSTLIYGDDKKFNHLRQLEVQRQKPSLDTMDFIFKALNCTWSIEEL